MKDFSVLFKSNLPITNGSLCTKAEDIAATIMINSEMERIQRDFDTKSEMSHTKVSGFHFSC